MTDHVRELHALAIGNPHHAATLQAAADHIEAQEAELARIKLTTARTREDLGAVCDAIGLLRAELAPSGDPR